MKDSQADAKQTYHHGDLKAVLLDETARILREEGEVALSLRSLAANVGVSRTAPYHHFKDKHSLLCAVAEEGFIRFDRVMKDALEKGRGQGGHHAMLVWAKAYLSFAVNNMEYYDLMFGGNLWRSKSLSKTLVSSARSSLRSDVERLKRLQDRGYIAKDLDVLRFTHLAWGTMHGMSRLMIDGIYTDSTSVKRLCETAADTLWAQLDPKLPSSKALS